MEHRLSMIESMFGMYLDGSIGQPLPNKRACTKSRHKCRVRIHVRAPASPGTPYNKKLRRLRQRASKAEGLNASEKARRTAEKLRVQTANQFPIRLSVQRLSVWTGPEVRLVCFRPPTITPNLRYESQLRYLDGAFTRNE